MSTPQPRQCRDCKAEGITTLRPTPYAGPRCTTHHRERRKAVSARAHGLRVEKVYGITEEDYWTLYEAQGGKCYVCQRSTGKAKRLAVDHDHNTGEIRCLACSTCNFVVLGRYDAQALARAIMVLETLPAQQVLNPQGRQH